MIIKVAQSLFSYFFPIACVICLENEIEKTGICIDCWKKLSLISYPYCNSCSRPLAFELPQMLCARCSKGEQKYILRSIFEFNQDSKRLIHNFKYYNKAVISKLSADILFRRYKDDILEYDYITYIPMHFLRRITRHYNHSYLLAREISKVSNIPILNSVIKKSKFTRSQTNLSRKSREENIIGSFKISRDMSLENKKIIIVDDVISTGATASEIVKILKKQGAVGVIILTIASNF